MPTFRGRQLNTDSDLRWLIGNQVQEGIDLEYKQEMYGPADEDKREMLRDIAAMANARGGFILIGIKEDEQGIAVDIPGIERGAHAERITSSCLSNIDPRLTPEISEIPLSSGKVVLVISVPSSLSAPHMITFKGLNQFWRRHNRQKAPMDVEEIRDAFLAASDRLERLRKRLAERRDQRRRKEASPSLLFQASPVLLQRGSINVGDLGLRVMLENRQWNFWGGLERTLEGLGVQDKGNGGMELHLDGYFEWWWVLRGDTDDKESIHAKAVKTYSEQVTSRVKQIYERTGVTPPLVLQVTLLNVRNFRLTVDLPGLRREERRWDEGDDILLPEVFIERWEDFVSAPQRFNEDLWHAFHYERCFLYQ